MQKNVLAFIRLTVTTLQTDHKDREKCREAITHLLNEADKLHEEITGKPVVKRKTILEHIVNR